jgi:glycosyltransferase involved in cell wall biosynthesis
VSGEREIPETGLARAGQEVRPSVVLTTYEQPRALELVLWGYARQTHTDFEIVVADDGSGPRTGEVIDRLRKETSLDIRRVWHEDRGFRKTEILNRAIVAAIGQYLIFSDGDCIPREDFVAVHTSEARADTFLSGGYLKLPRGLSESLTADDVCSGSVFRRSWLASRGWKGGRRRLRLTRSRRVGTILDRVTPTRATWNGHNASTWKGSILAVNGFDMDMGYGGLDRALGERLANIGVSGRQIRHRAPCLHVWHPRPYRTPEVTAANRAIRDRIRANREEWARVGIAELGDSDASV